VKQTVLKIMQATGVFTPFRFANRNRALILTYHRFSEVNGSLATGAAAFEKQLDYLSKSYRIVRLSWLVRLLRGPDPLPPNLAAITIDDGYRDVYRVAFPILRARGIPATVFATTGFVDRSCWLWPDRTRYAFLKTPRKIVICVVADRVLRLDLPDRGSRIRAAELVNGLLKRIPDNQKHRVLAELERKLEVRLPSEPPRGLDALTWDEIRELNRAGIEIGSHTVSHPVLTRVKPGELFRELVSSKERLESELSREVDLFCYPNGDMDKRIRSAVAAAGYRAAVTTEPGFNDATSDLLALRRVPTESDMAHFVQSTSGFEELKNRIVPTRRREVVYQSQ
jgi:peptidoglycan/xylan/chitin deacetylase (PgdA/CDA1 family)